MAEDHYTRWLNIPPGPRPPAAHVLLDVPRDSSARRIEQAAHDRLQQLDPYAAHRDPKLREACARMMNEVAQARNEMMHRIEAGGARRTEARSTIEPVPPGRPPVRTARWSAVRRALLTVAVGLVGGAVGWGAAMLHSREAQRDAAATVQLLAREVEQLEALAEGLAERLDELQAEHERLRQLTARDPQPTAPEPTVPSPPPVPPAVPEDARHERAVEVELPALSAEQWAAVQSRGQLTLETPTGRDIDIPFTNGFASLVRLGEPADDGAGVINRLFTPGFSADGQVAFLADIHDEAEADVQPVQRNLYLHRWDGKRIIAGTQGLEIFAPPQLNRMGHVVFNAVKRDDRRESSIHLHDGESLRELVRRGDPVPQGQATFGFFNISRINDAGQIVIPAMLDDVEDSLGDEALYLYSSSGLSELVRTGQRVPQGDARFASLGRPRLAGNGHVAFTAALHDADEDTFTGDGLYVHDGQAPRELVRSGATDVEVVRTRSAEGTLEWRFGQLGGIDLGDAGHVAFHATLYRGSQVQGSIHLHDGDQRRRLARTGARVPGQEPGFDEWRFVTLADPRVNAAGQVAFLATVGQRRSDAEIQAIYLHDGDELIEIVRHGDPGPPGGFGGFSALQLLDSGHVAFISGGSLYVASPGQIVRVIDAGDTLGEGESIPNVGPSYHVRETGWVRFTAPQGVFLTYVELP